MHRPVLDVEAFFVAGARDSAPCQKWAKREGFVAASRTLAAWDIWRGSDRLCKDAFRMADAAQETHESDMFGADFLGMAVFCRIKSWSLLGWFCVRRGTPYHLASLFRTLNTWSGKIAKTHWYEAVSFALSFPLLKEVSQNCCVFGVVNVAKWESPAEQPRFGCCQLRKLRKSGRIASFLTLSSWKIEDV